MSYSPPYIVVTKPIPQIRLGIMGAPGSGKTTAALTFPNPIVLDKDRKCPKDVRSIPFYDPEFEKHWSDKAINRTGPRSALINFLKQEGPKFDPDTTFILDSWTMWFHQFDIWAEKVGPVAFATEARPGKPSTVDNFAIHGDRISYGFEIMEAMKALPCNFIINFHEQSERNAEGNVIGIKLVCKGQFGDQAASHVTAFFRQIVVAEKDKPAQYLWQVSPTNEFKGAICPPGVKEPRPKLIKADYESFLKLFQA